MCHKTLKNYHTIHKNKVFEYPSKDREKVMSTALKPTVKRTDVYISEDLVKDYFNTPINEKKKFYLLWKKKKIDKKKDKLLFRQKIF